MQYASVGALLTPVFIQAGFVASFFGLTAQAEFSGHTGSDIYNAQTVPLLRAAINSNPYAAIGGGDIVVDEDGVLVPSLGPSSGEDKAINNGEISTYVVRPDDSLSQIADMFGVSVHTILWANDIKDVNTIQPGDTLVVLPV